MTEPRPEVMLITSTSRDEPPVRALVGNTERMFWREWTARVQRDDVPHVVLTLRMRVDEGVPVCRYVTMSLDPNRTWKDTRLPTATQVDRIIRDVIARSAFDDDDPLWADVDVGIEEGRGAGASRQPLVAAQRARRRPTIDDEFLRNVASQYRAAVEAGEHPRPAIASHHVVATATVANWIRWARERTDPTTGAKFLGPANGPRAGEGIINA